MKIEIVDYFDVWGNQEDGWEVNDVIRHTVEVDKESDVFLELSKRGIVEFNSTYADYFVMDMENGFELFDKETDLPICAVYFL